MLFALLAIAFGRQDRNGDEVTKQTFNETADWFFKRAKMQPPVEQSRVMAFAERVFREVPETDNLVVNLLTGMMLRMGVENGDVTSGQVKNRLTEFVDMLSSENEFIDSNSFKLQLAQENKMNVNGMRRLRSRKQKNNKAF